MQTGAAKVGEVIWLTHVLDDIFRLHLSVCAQEAAASGLSPLNNLFGWLLGVRLLPGEPLIGGPIQAEVLGLNIEEEENRH